MTDLENIYRLKFSNNIFLFTLSPILLDAGWTEAWKPSPHHLPIVLWYYLIISNYIIIFLYFANVLKLIANACNSLPFLWLFTDFFLSLQYILWPQVNKASFIHSGFLTRFGQVFLSKLNHTLAIFYFMMWFGRTVRSLNVLVYGCLCYSKLSILKCHKSNNNRIFIFLEDWPCYACFALRCGRYWP